MKKQKRALAAMSLALALTASAALTGCGKQTDPEPSGSTVPQSSTAAVQPTATKAPQPTPTPTPERDWREDYPQFFGAGQSREDYIQEQMVDLMELRQKSVSFVRNQMTANINAFFSDFNGAQFIPPEPIDGSRELCKDLVASLVGAVDSPLSDMLGDVAAKVIDNGTDDLWGTVSSTALESIGSKLSGSVQDAVLEAVGLDGVVSTVQKADGAISMLRDIFDGTPDYALARTLQDALSYAQQVTAVLEDPNADVARLYEALDAYNQFCAYRRAAMDLRDESGLTAMGEFPMYGSLAEVETIDRALGIYAVLLKSEIEGDQDWYEKLSETWETLPERMTEARGAVSVLMGTEYTLPPNYDRPCLTYLQTGNKIYSGIMGVIGGALGNAAGNQQNNMSQEDVERLHVAVNGLTDRINAAVQQAERTRTAWQMEGFLIDKVFDPELPGPALESQILFLERMYPLEEDPEARNAMIHDAAYAVVTMRCGEEIYATLLSDSQERTDYLARMAAEREELQWVLREQGIDRAEDCLSQEELEDIYRWTVQTHTTLGLFVQGSQVWKDANTMQSVMINTGRDAGMAVGDQVMLITWRAGGKQMMYATDPKGDITAYYGFSRSGVPMYFSRGGELVLFDWTSGDGSALYSTYDDGKVQALYKFSTLLQQKRNGFNRNEYLQNQTAY